MKVREIWDMACNNLKGRKSVGKLLKLIFFLALFVFFLSSAIMNSIDNTLQLAKETPMARKLVYHNLDNEQLEILEEVCAELEYVQGIYPFIYELPVPVKGMEDSHTEQLLVQACSDNYQDYLVEGKSPKKGEILLPHYMYAINGRSYEDGSRYIGKTISLYVTDCNDKQTEYRCRVSGTYDNIYAVTGAMKALLPPEDAVYLEELNMVGVEDQLQKEMELSGDFNPDNYVGYEMQYHYAVIIDSVDHVEEVNESVYKEIEISGYMEVDLNRGYIGMMYPFIKIIGYGIVIILMIAVILMLTVIVRNDIRGRKKEVAMYLVQGYSRKNLRHIFRMEYVIRFIPVLMCSILLTGGILMLINLIIRNYLSMELQILHMELTMGTMASGIVIWGIVLTVAIYTIAEQLKRIVLLEEIKSEG